ncbi:MAG: hypothetical protein QOE97_1153 [Pseudonocardiales bacterium]|jgi:hypothetical protein|nr:hypothetical protein [Pseudonocardiales bacterium]
MTVCRFGPDRRITAATGGLALIAAAASALAADTGGRLLFALAALVLLAYTVSDLVFWPRIVASTAAGLDIRSPLGSEHLEWHEVEAVRADSRQRLGLRSVTLEIDTGTGLHVFGRRALGADPESVAGLIRAVDPRRP